jgi:hypothetical protein
MAGKDSWQEEQRRKHNQAVRDVGSPIFVVDSLMPYKVTGWGGGREGSSHVEICCGEFPRYVYVDTSTEDHRLPLLSLATIALPGIESELEFPLTLEHGWHVISVDNAPTNFEVVSCGQSWAGRAERGNRWLQVRSQTSTPEAFSLVIIDPDELLDQLVP